MAPIYSGESPFRFLDLPTELRLIVYEHVEIVALRDTLTREDANLPDGLWPTEPVKSKSSITFISPHLPLEILKVCHSIHKEASPIFKHKLERLKLAPVRYLVDYNALYALIKPVSPLKACLGHTSWKTFRTTNDKIKLFTDRCSKSLYTTLPEHAEVAFCRNVEIAITYDRKGDESRAALSALVTMAGLVTYLPNRVDVVYQSPLPSNRGPAYETNILQRVNTETQWNTIRTRGGERLTSIWSLTGLGEEEFSKHLEGMDKY
jgi:hypothetical protein